jgi:hypothetical protein
MWIEFHWVFNSVVWEFSSSIEQIKVPWQPHLLVSVPECHFIFLLDIPHFGLTQCKHKLVLQYHFVCDILMSNLPISIILHDFSSGLVFLQLNDHIHFIGRCVLYS